MLQQSGEQLYKCLITFTRDVLNTGVFHMGKHSAKRWPSLKFEVWRWTAHFTRVGWPKPEASREWRTHSKTQAARASELEPSPTQKGVPNPSWFPAWVSNTSAAARVGVESFRQSAWRKSSWRSELQRHVAGSHQKGNYSRDKPSGTIQSNMHRLSRTGINQVPRHLLAPHKMNRTPSKIVCCFKLQLNIYLYLKYIYIY